MAAGHSSHCMPWSVASQPLVVDFSAGALVVDAGLLAVRSLDVSLGVLSGLARRLPDPRSPEYVRHSVESLLVQMVYQFLAGYPDGNDANHTRHDALFQILQGLVPDPRQPLASTATLNRFLYASTRRDAEPPREDRPALLEQRRARVQRPRACDDDVDPTDDEVHGQQALAAYHDYYRQHQYLPLLHFEGHTGFPLSK